MFILLTSCLVGYASAQSGNCPKLDIVSSCPQLAQYCPINSIVRDRCRNTCNNCPATTPPPQNMCDATDPNCCDQSDKCDLFDQAGACNNPTAGIQRICRNTCKLCGTVDSCADSPFDCYSEQMACAQEVAAQGQPVSQKTLSVCVQAKVANKQGCCRDYVDGVMLCQNNPNDPKCQATPRVSPVKITSRYFTNEKGCRAINSAKYRSTDVHAYELGCNEVTNTKVYKNYGSVSISCGSQPAEIELTYFRTTDCKGRSVRVFTMKNGDCNAVDDTKNNGDWELSLFTAPRSCGRTKPPKPVGPQITTQAKWKSFCGKKTNAADCISCGGKWKNSKGVCKVKGKNASKELQRIKCGDLSEEVCNSLGCTWATRKQRCTGDARKAW